MVVPNQPWLDGYCVEKGVIRQFIAMPLGKGYTAEEQLTGAAKHGGLQVSVCPMKHEIYEIVRGPDDAGLPWFDYYGGDREVISVRRLAGLKTCETGLGAIAASRTRLPGLSAFHRGSLSPAGAVEGPFPTHVVDATEGGCGSGSLHGRRLAGQERVGPGFDLDGPHRATVCGEHPSGPTDALRRSRRAERR